MPYDYVWWDQIIIKINCLMNDIDDSHIQIINGTKIDEAHKWERHETQTCTHCDWEMHRCKIAHCINAQAQAHTNTQMLRQNRQSRTKWQWTQTYKHALYARIAAVAVEWERATKQRSYPYRPLSMQWNKHNPAIWEMRKCSSETFNNHIHKNV